MDKALLKIHEIYYNDETDIYTVRTPSNGNFEISKPEFLTAQYEYKKNERSKGSAYALWFLLGILGAHRYYVGDYLRGALLMFTLGGFLIGWLADCAYLGKRVEECNADLETEVLAKAIDATRIEKERQTKRPAEKVAV